MSDKTTISTTNVEQSSCHEQVGKKKIKRLDTPCCLHIHSRRYRLVDADGISAKAAIDGIVHANLLPDDSASYVEKVSYSQEKIPKKETEETIITIYTEGE